MTKRFLTLISLFSTISRLAYAQQDPQFSQYIFSQQFYNPSVVSTESLPKVQLLHRSQYIGYVSNFDNGGILNTQLLSFQMPLLKSKSGIGIVIINDQVGLEKNNQVKFSYGKNLKIATGFLSVGVSAGFYNKSFSNDFRPREGSDPSIPAGGFSQIKPDFGFGVNYSNKFLFGGISINHINNPKFDFGASNGNNIINRNLIGLFGLKLPMNSKIEISPNLLFRSDLLSYNIEGGVMVDIGNKYWGGVNYRKQDAAIFMAGLSLMNNNALKLGLAYDIVTNQTAIKSNSTLEIMASYVIGNKNPKAQKVPPRVPIIRTPRYRH